MNILYISSHIVAKQSGGRMVSSNNLKLITHAVNEVCSVKVIAVGREKHNYHSVACSLNTLQVALYSFLGYSSLLQPLSILQILEYIDEVQPDLIWLDGSLFGKVIEKIKKKYPLIKIVCFFHNVELDYSISAVRNRQLSRIPVFLANYLNEKKSVRHADKLVTLHKEDSNRLLTLYKRKADSILPVCIDDSYRKYAINESNGRKKMLFVGSDFPPNIHGLRFFIKKVMPYVNVDLVVVGMGMERYKNEFSAQNISIFGFIDDISSAYAKADFVVAPIYIGAGMKVKIAEALMYGKCVIATPFAAIGYDAATEIGVVKIADDSADFIHKINNFYGEEFIKCRDLFCNQYSFFNGEKIVKEIIDSIG